MLRQLIPAIFIIVRLFTVCGVLSRVLSLCSAMWAVNGLILNRSRFNVGGGLVGSKNGIWMFSTSLEYCTCCKYPGGSLERFALSLLLNCHSVLLAGGGVWAVAPGGCDAVWAEAVAPAEIGRAHV